MALSLTSLCNFRISLTELTSLSSCMHSSYTMILAIFCLRSLYLYRIPCMIRREILVLQYRFQYSNVCSSMISVHPEGGGSTRDIRVSLINADVVFGLIMCCWMLPFTMVEVANKW